MIGLGSQVFWPINPLLFLSGLACFAYYINFLQWSVLLLPYVLCALQKKRLQNKWKNNFSYIFHQSKWKQSKTSSFRDLHSKSRYVASSSSSSAQVLALNAWLVIVSLGTLMKIVSRETHLPLSSSEYCAFELGAFDYFTILNDETGAWKRG